MKPIQDTNSDLLAAGLARIPMNRFGGRIEIRQTYTIDKLLVIVNIIIIMIIIIMIIIIMIIIIMIIIIITIHIHIHILTCWY